MWRMKFRIKSAQSCESHNSSKDKDQVQESMGVQTESLANITSNQGQRTLQLHNPVCRAICGRVKLHQMCTVNEQTKLQPGDNLIAGP